MKQIKISFVMALMGAMGIHAWAEALYVGAFSSATNDVQTGTQEQVDAVTVAPEGKLYKTGGGEWRVPANLLTGRFTGEVAVANGTLALDFVNPGTAPATVAEPAVIREKAQFWVSTKDPDASHIVTDANQGVSYWYDVREGDMSAPAVPTRIYAQETNLFVTTLAKRVTKDGFDSIYFGGLQSGVTMSWRYPGGADESDYVCQMFVVYGAYTSWGNVIGTQTGAGSAWWTVDKSFLTYFYPYTDYPAAMCNRFYVDGMRVDGYVESVKSGFHVADSYVPEGLYDGRGGAFFGMQRSKSYSGGDYLCEAIVFTNALTEAERVQIADYLQAKWFTQSVVSKKNVTLSSAATLALEVPADNLISNPPLNVVGNGTIEKRGAGELILRNSDSPDAKVNIKAGAVVLNGAFAMDVTKGKRITSTWDGVNGTRVGVPTAAARATALEKAGDGVVAVEGLPAGTKSISVEGGTLDIRRKANVALDDSDQQIIPLENGSFEDVPDEYFTDNDAAGAYSLPATGTEFYGWTKANGNAVRIVDWSLWKGPSPNTEKTGPTGWAIYSAPPDGNRFLMMRTGASVYTPVTLERAGEYEVSLWLINRYATEKLGQALDILLQDSKGNTVATFGRAAYVAFRKTYQRVALRAAVATAGTYRLMVKVAEAGNSDRTFFVDDIHMRRIPEVKAGTVYKVPYGDFETIDGTVGVNLRSFCGGPTVPNWTFDWPFKESTDLGVGVVVPTMYGTEKDFYNGRYNDTRVETGGQGQIFFRTNGTATTTFTPPKGHWYAQADLATFYGRPGSLAATVRVGETDYALGNLKLSANRWMKTFTWPGAFYADGETAVTLTFTFVQDAKYPRQSSAWMDDVKLVSVTPEEIIQNGGFEGASSQVGSTRLPFYWTLLTSQVPTNFVVSKDGTVANCAYELLPNPEVYHSGNVQPYSYAPQHHCGDKIDGDLFFIGTRLGGLYQNVNFAVPGVYRVSFWLTSQTGPTAGWYCNNRVKTWLADGDSTNVLGIVGNTYTTNYVQYVYHFLVPTAGERKLGFSGLSTSRGETFILDAVSLRQVDTLPADDEIFPKDMKIDVAEGAKLRVEFKGTNRIERLNLGGNRVEGFVDVADYPDYLEGYGVFEVKGRGFTLFVR